MKSAASSRKTPRQQGGGPLARQTSTASLFSSAASDDVNSPDESIMDLIADARRNLAINRLNKLQVHKGKLLEKQEKLREKLALGKRLDEKVQDDEKKLAALKSESARFAILHKSVLVGADMKEFSEMYIEPLLKTYVPLYMSDEAFEELKAAFSTFEENMCNESNVELFKQTLTQIESLNLCNSFISTILEQISAEDLKKEANAMDKMGEDLAKLKVDVDKFDGLLKKLKGKSVDVGEKSK